MSIKVHPGTITDYIEVQCFYFMYKLEQHKAVCFAGKTYASAPVCAVQVPLLFSLLFVRRNLHDLGHNSFAFATQPPQAFCFITEPHVYIGTGMLHTTLCYSDLPNYILQAERVRIKPTYNPTERAVMDWQPGILQLNASKCDIKFI